MKPARAMFTLGHEALAGLPAGVRAPGYRLSAVSPGMVHLGLGGFHRAHMARYTHDLFELDEASLGWGIPVVGLMPDDRGMVDDLATQDGLYTLVEREAEDAVASVIGSFNDVHFAATRPRRCSWPSTSRRSASSA